MDGIPKSVQQTYDQVGKSGLSAEPDRVAFFKLLKECFAKFSKVFLLVDAFDECADNEKANIMRNLHQLPESKLRLFITSRTAVDDDRRIRADPELKEWLETAVVKQIAASREDVETYLMERIQEDARDLDKGIKQQIITTITSKAEGQYYNPASISLYVGFCLPISS
jgi:hypothetical protein